MHIECLFKSWMVNDEVQEKDGWIKNYLSIVVIHYVAAQQILLLLAI